MLQSFRIIIFFLMLKLILGQHSCCQGNSFIRPDVRFCSDGSDINIQCSDVNAPDIVLWRFSNYDFEIDENESLIGGFDATPSGMYCYDNKSKDLLDGLEELFLLCANTHKQFTNSFDIDQMIVLAVVSSIFYTLTIILYALVQEWKNLQGQCIMNAVTGSLISCLARVGINIYDGYYISDTFCHRVAYTIYFSSIYGFVWLNLLCFNIWKQVIQPKCLQPIKRWTLFYYLYGIGYPLISLSILMLIHHLNVPNLNHIHPGIAEASCLFKSPREALVYYNLPIGGLLISNVIYFIWTIIKLWTTSKAHPNRKILICRLVLFLKLFLVMGVFWICEVLSASMINLNIISEFSWIFTDVINALQGLITFLVLVIFRKKIMHALANKRICGSELSILKRWKHINVSECQPLQETVVSDVPMENYLVN